MKSLGERLKAVLNPELVLDVHTGEDEVRLILSTPLRLSDVYKLVAAVKGFLSLYGIRANEARIDGEDVHLVLRVEKRQPHYHA